MIERTPEGILGFWLGPLAAGVAATSEDTWRERMLRWRVGVFARGREDPEFTNAQRELYEQLHTLGHERFFDPAERWETPKGWLAKLIVLDQLGRCVHRGTPLAYENDALTAPMLRHICDAGWDLGEYDLCERMWVYVALSHPEDRSLQELSVEKWQAWSSALVAASPAEHRRVNQRVAWYFVKSVIEHGEAVLVHGKFPHRNPILCRPHRAGEIHYLTGELRPLWSFTQPPRPLYYALHAALHATAENADCRELDRPALERFEHALVGEGARGTGSVLDIFDVTQRGEVSFHDFYRHLSLSTKDAALGAYRDSGALQPYLRRVTHAIFKDETATWPPASAKMSVPRVIDVPALNLAIGCPHLSAGDIRVPRAAIDAFVATTGFARRPLSELLARYHPIVAEARMSFVPGADRVQRSVPVTRRELAQLAGCLFANDETRDAAISTLYELLDLDYDGTVDAGELLVALNVLCSGTRQERLEMCFSVFDRDGSGRLESDELWDLVHTTLLRGLHLCEALFLGYLPDDHTPDGDEVRLFSLADFAAIEQTAARALREADSDGDGAVDRAEFFAWADAHPLLGQLFGLSDVLFGGR